MPNLIIGDHNYRDYLGELQPDGSRIYDFEGPRICGLTRPRRLRAPAPGLIMFPEERLIPFDEWPDRIAEKNANKSWPRDIIEDQLDRGIMKVSDQDGLGYCHAYAEKNCAEYARLIQNHPYVEGSAESIGGPITNWRNQGAMPDDDLRQMLNGGMCPASMMDQPWSLRPSRWQDGWEREALKFRVKEYWDFDIAGKTFQAAGTAAFEGIATNAGFGWWLHAVLSSLRVRELNPNARRPQDRFGIDIWNSWGPNWGDRGFATLTGDKAVPDLDLHGIRQMVAYDG